MNSLRGSTGSILGAAETSMVLNQQIAQVNASAGFAVIPGVLSAIEIDHLVLWLEQTDDRVGTRRRGNVYAIRNLFDVVPDVRRPAASTKIKFLAESVLGAEAFAVQAILFDKPPEANWKVPWHQDLTIAVRERKDVLGFGPWSIKAEALHVQPPAYVLQRMLAIRVHLDNCDESNAPLRVIPGSHLLGRLSTDQIGQISRHPKTSGPVEAGGAMLMRPLLLHASSASRLPAHRRVIHIEFASSRLPGGLE